MVQRLRGRITQQSWATLALMAMLAVFTSPTLAFACCCQSASAVLSHTGASNTAKPDADGCCEDEEGQSAVEQGAHIEHQHAKAAPEGVACITDICHCSHADSTVMAFVDLQSSSAFFPLVMGVVSGRFAFSVSSDERIAAFFASRALRPRPPTDASRSSRAPPVFSL